MIHLTTHLPTRAMIVTTTRVNAGTPAAHLRHEGRPDTPRGVTVTGLTFDVREPCPPDLDEESVRHEHDSLVRGLDNGALFVPFAPDEASGWMLTDGSGWIR